MKSLARLATVLYIVALPVFLVSANVRFVASDSWFSKDGFRRHRVEETTRVSLPQLDDAADDITRYFEDDRTVLRIPVTINGQETSLFNERETDHMRDVKTLMRAVFRLNEVSLAVILLYVGAVVLWARERTPRDLARYSLFGLALGLLVVGTVGAFAVTGFDAAWTKFHEIAFRNDLWVLDPARDRLIQMFPEPFWEEMTYLVGALTLVEAVAVVSVASLYLLFSKDAREEA
ncbi:MAG TPA: TIGR01906 family membrane protein [Tepidiformaceae bacterium]|nr:TIGR01906 family membrane protein [Tepidiformaceae bacterium]